MPAFTITAPSRLHFGLWSFGDVVGRQFGGAGVMIERPALVMSIVAGTDGFQVNGDDAERAQAFARRWSDYHGLALPNCCLSIEQAIPGHAGLGSGTQLALGTAALLGAYAGLGEMPAQEMAKSVGRGLRSAVGTHGFAFGGLVVEQGKLAEEDVSPLEYRLDFPAAWRFVLLTPRGVAGLAGPEEVWAFDCLPPVPSAVTARLLAEVHERLVPAAASGEFEAFSDSVYRYGRLAGECFAARQGGPYNGPLVTSLVEAVRAAGCHGVGQSSWGPTVFAVTESQAAAEELVRHVERLWRDPLSMVIAPAANHGARLVEHAWNGELAAA